jgi:low affinity Fe/Cu permease
MVDTGTARTGDSVRENDNKQSVRRRYAWFRPKQRSSLMKDAFRLFAEKSAQMAGTHWAFLLAVITVLVWAITGPYFGYSDTWQLVINTGTTIITFLMVFLIQNSQNRETRVMALKLDELLRGVEGARTAFVNLDNMSDDALEAVQKEFTRLREHYAPLIDDDLAYVEREITARRKRH